MKKLILLLLLPLSLLAQEKEPPSFKVRLTRIASYTLVPEIVYPAGFINANDSVDIIGYGQEGYYKAKYKGLIIYIEGSRIERNNEFIAFEKPMKEQSDRDLALVTKKALAEKAKAKAALRVMYIKKYGSKFGTDIANNLVSLGMTKAMALASWGKPNDVNRTVGSWGVHEQWVYDDNYLYFENGKLTSWQD